MAILQVMHLLMAMWFLLDQQLHHVKSKMLQQAKLLLAALMPLMVANCMQRTQYWAMLPTLLLLA